MTSDPGPVAPAEQPRFSRTPFYEAVNAARYQRQGSIRDIEEITKRRLAVYWANVAHFSSSISQEDVSPFEDLLFDCVGCDIDLLLQSPGGDVDIAEKLVYMLRERARSVRVIVAERAKSAATLIALAADSILMSSTAELGPIDPQITIFTADGKPLHRPAQSFLDGLEQIKKSVVESGELNPAYFPLLAQLDPALLDFCQKAIDRARQFAEKWLSRHMLAQDHAKARSIASRLTNVDQYRSHGMVIDWREAKEIGLSVEHLEDKEDVWRHLWKLHLLYEVDCQSRQMAKVFETRKVSIPRW